MIKNYFKIAWRNLVRNKSYALINIIGLSLGVGCGLLIFMLVTYHLNFDTFHSNSSNIYRVVTEFHEDNVQYTPGVPQPLAKAFALDYPFAQQIARVKSQKSSLITLSQESTIKKFEEEQNVAFADPQFFSIFNFPLIAGEKSSALSSPNSALITEHIANKYFGTTNAVGKIIRLDNKINFQIVGILKNIPANTDRKEEIYLSYQNLKDVDSVLARDDSWGRVSSSMQCFISLKASIPVSTVNASFKQFAKKHLSAEDAKTTVFKLQPLKDIHFNTDFGADMDKKYLFAFILVGVFLIVTACVNFVNLATAQALGRAKEVGVRKVMGGMPKQLFWQFMIETAIITLLAIVVAYGFAYFALPYLNSLFEIKMELSLFKTPGLIYFLCAVLLVVTFFSGSYPGLVLARFEPIVALKGKLSQQNVGGFSLRRILVITQFSISQVLIIGTLVIASQMHFSNTSDLGFTKDGIVILPIPVSHLSKMNTLRTRLSSIPGVESITDCFQPPASQSNHSTDFRYANNTKDELWEINEKDADNLFVKTFGLKLVAGRNIFPSDTAREFLVNETVVKKLNLRSAHDIIGKTIHSGGHTGTVVGVLKDFYNTSFHYGIAPICITSNSKNYNNCAIKVNLHNLTATMMSFEKIWNNTYPDQLYSYQFLDERIAKFYKTDTTMLWLIECFAGVAIFIGCLGLYGLISFMAARKTKEIGVRKVLGASVKNIIWLFGKELSLLLSISFLIAAPVGWWVMNNYLQDFRYRISLSPGIFIAAVTSTFIIATITVGYRSMSAAFANPVNSLRSE